MMQTANDWSRGDSFVRWKTVSVSGPRCRSRAGFRHARTQAAVRTASIVVPDPFAQDASQMADRRAAKVESLGLNERHRDTSP